MQQGDSKNWQTISGPEALTALQVDGEGLSLAQVKERQTAHGLNQLPEKLPPGPWIVFLHQFISPLIYILVAAAVVSLLVGEWKDALFIAIVLVMNAIIGAVQEYRAEQTNSGLRKLLQFRALVRRDGRSQDVASTEVTVGDLVLLESGNRVPADIRLLDTQDLKIDESLLTGESLAVAKDAGAILNSHVDLAEQVNMAFAGSMVTRGRGRGVVVAVGPETSVGKLAVSLDDSGGKPPLLVRMERFTNFVAIATLTTSALIGAIRLIFYGSSWVETFFFVTALAVSAIPEGLPVAMTITLAVASSRMAKRNVIVRRLAAVEGLGSCTTIATDKTGTLTCNQLTVQQITLADQTVIQVTGEGFQPVGELLCDTHPVRFGRRPGLDALLQAVEACNEAELRRDEAGNWQWHGDTVDAALLVLVEKAGMKRDATRQVLGSIPYESEKQFAAVFLDDGQTGQGLVHVKGSPEKILGMCQDPEDQLSRFYQLAESLASQGLRVLAVASGHWEPAKQGGVREPVWENHLQGLTFLGFVGMSDPLRPGVKDAVRQCQSAGVRVIMVTGDHQVTALSIARDLGLAQEREQVCTGKQWEALSPDHWGQRVNQVSVFARVTPEQKLQIVNAARSTGQFVAVTGDGVNDAPALRAANIGVAMGKGGTDVAREAAELVIADDNFTSIVSGVEEGRIAYDNIRKVIFLLVAMGAAELLLVLLAVLTGMPLPLLPVQLLWLNLVTDGIQSVAMAFEPGEGDSLRHPPRDPDEPIFNALMVQRILISVAVVGGGGFLVFFFAMRAGYALEHARNLLLLVLVLTENFHVGNCRTETKSAFTFSPLRSPVLLIGTVAAFLLHVLSLYLPPLQDVLSTSPLGLRDWMIAVLVAGAIIPAIEWHKWWWNRRHGLNSIETGR